MRPSAGLEAAPCLDFASAASGLDALAADCRQVEDLKRFMPQLLHIVRPGGTCSSRALRERGLCCVPHGCVWRQLRPALLWWMSNCLILLLALCGLHAADLLCCIVARAQSLACYLSGKGASPPCGIRTAVLFLSNFLA